MTLNLSKICRICFAEGARNIFDRTNSATQMGGDTGGGVECVASLENLLEKMRYVTMAQLKETDPMPKMICDLCIVQLNISYNFKRKAMENDLKLRQYIIEKGLDTVTEENTNTTSALYYSSNISFVHNTENVSENPATLPYLNESGSNEVVNSNSTNCAITSEQAVPINQVNSTVANHIPIKVESSDSPVIDDEHDTRLNSEFNFPNPNLMVMVNENVLLNPSPSSNSTATIMGTMSDSSSTTVEIENNLRDNEFLRTYVHNGKTDIIPNATSAATQWKIENRNKSIQRMKKLRRDKFLQKHITKHLGQKVSRKSSAAATASPTTDNMKISTDLRNLIFDQKENFSSVLKMRKHNKSIFYSLRHKTAKKGVAKRPKEDEKNRRTL